MIFKGSGDTVMEMCMEFGDLLDEFRDIFGNERDKGTKFEDLILKLS